VERREIEMEKRGGDQEIRRAGDRGEIEECGVVYVGG